VILIWGCGDRAPPRQPVRGRVTNNGQPVADAVIIFQNDAAGIGVMAELDDDGSYTVDTHNTTGLPAGTYSVAVKPRLLSELSPNMPPPTTAVPGTPSQLIHPLIPKKFFSGSTSGLRAEVKPGADRSFDFDLAKSSP
jgi:hypothetical protein